MHEHNSIVSQSPVIQPVSKDAAFSQHTANENICTESFYHFPLQRKLSVGAVDDPLEDEADNMADKVMRMPEPNFIQRKCAHCEEEEKAQRKPLESFIQKKCAACEQEERAQRKPLASFIQKKETSTNNNVLASNNVSNRIQSTKGSGNVMPETTKSFMESRFGTDFSSVKIHTGNYASQLSKELSAQAFTVGNDIYFNEGKYQPESSEGKHLLAHELTHTIQQRNGVSRKIQRFSAACRGLLNNPTGSLARVLTGAAVHLAILEDFMTTVSGGLSGFGIPGASAAPLRTAGLCGEDIANIVPQIIGGRAGMGFPDLVRRTGSIAQIAEIKPASWTCAVDGVAQLAGYLAQGNAPDATQTAWRAAQGISLLVPMPSNIYPGKTFIIGNYTVQTEWCSPGLLVYQVIGSSLPVPVPVPLPETQPSPVQIRQRSGWERVRDFAEQAIRTGATSAAAIRAFLQENPDLINVVIGIGIAGLVATFAEDIATLGAGILDDLVTVPFFAAMIRIAMQLKPA